MAVLLCGFAGCASGPDSRDAVARTVPAPEESVRRAVREVLIEFPGYREEDADRWTTGWIEGESRKREMGFFMRRPLLERRRYLVRLTSAPNAVAVRVLCQVQEKGLGGASARAWTTIASDGYHEAQLLDRIQAKTLPAAAAPVKAPAHAPSSEPSPLDDTK